MNRPAEISKRYLVITTAIIAAIIMICGVMTVVVVTDPAVKYSHILSKAAMTIQKVYPDPVDWGKVSLAAREAMVSELDPFSGYVEKEELVQYKNDLSGGYFGIGISVYPHESGLLILDVREGSPASSAGLLTGDIIIASDSVSLKDLSPMEAARLIKGEENTILEAKVFRPATDDTLMFEIIRKRIEFLHIPFAGFTTDSAIYVRLLDFNAGAAGDLKKAVDSLSSKGGQKAKGIILDLRDNPGGLLSEAGEIVELFLDEGEFIVGTSSRSRWHEEQFVAQKSGEYSDYPVVIILSRGSASASEIVAGALKYSGNAVLIGDTTYGKGLVQGIVKMLDGDGIRLTISRYFFDGGKYINVFDSFDGEHAAGLPPDIPYQFEDENPFFMELERSLALLEFAHKYQDELVVSRGDQESVAIWIDQLRKYAFESSFQYRSVLTQAAEEFSKEVESGSLKRLAQKAVAMAESLDTRLFEKQSAFIWMRLRQIAFERKFGTYRAYQEVVVSEFGPILLAESLLAKKDSL